MEDTENTISCANCYWAGPINEDGFADCHYLCIEMGYGLGTVTN